MSESPTSPDDSIIAQAGLMQAAGLKVRHIVDGGAFEGVITARYLDCFPEAHLWAFEPTPAQVEGLSKRFDGNPRVTVVPAALGAGTGRAELALNDAPATNSLLPLDDAASSYLDYPVKTQGSVVVRTETLDNFCTDHGIDHLSIVKLDVQGWEQAVLDGAHRLFRDGAIDLFFTEVNFVFVYERQARLWDLMSRLDSYGYRLYDLYGARRSPQGQLKWCDALFTSPAFRSAAGL
jgi:FkbM family methyltransferase